MSHGEREGVNGKYLDYSCDSCQVHTAVDIPQGQQIVDVNWDTGAASSDGFEDIPTNWFRIRRYRKPEENDRETIDKFRGLLGTTELCHGCYLNYVEAVERFDRGISM